MTNPLREEFLDALEAQGFCDKDKPIHIALWAFKLGMEKSTEIANRVAHLPKLEPGEEWSQDAVDAACEVRNQIVEAIRKAKESVDL